MDPETWGVAEFGAALLAGAQGSLLYIGAGVAAGAVVFAVMFGLRKGISALRTVAK